MAAETVRNNHDNGLANLYLFRGRKAACRSKAPQGILIKKPTAVSVWHDAETMCSHNGKKRKPPELLSTSDDFTNQKRVRLPDFPIVDGYHCLGEISSGSYGAVYKVQHKITGEIRAMKKEFSGMCSTTQAEIDILQSMGGGHPSIVGFKEVVVDAKGGVYVVMEYLEFNLKGYIHMAEEDEEEEALSIAHVKRLMKQLIEGVHFLHQNRVLHRDLKPSNILVNKQGDLKICDFGLAMRFGEESGSTVGTLWYMAPELLLGETSYTCAVDMWAVGCVMAELVLGKVLFRGKSKEDQMHEIYCILGHPSNNNVGTTISSARYKLCDAGFDLLKRLLACDPTERITSQVALSHAWLEMN